MAWEGINRRRFPRANYTCVVTVRRKGDSETFNTKTENIGCGGVCVMLPKAVGIFNPVEIDLDLSNADSKINCQGTVVWVVHRSEIANDAPDQFDTGIEFSDLKNEDRMRIERVIKECLRKNKS